MTPAEITAALQLAFAQCDVAFCSLTQRQKEILLQILIEELTNKQNNADAGNPLDELTPEERDILLQFVKQQESQNERWKVKLLNDWVENRDSGAVQFLRDRYGLGWLNRIKREHLTAYLERENLKVGDRIEVSNSLWEWVQEEGPCSREWIPCTVVSIYETNNGVFDRTYQESPTHTNCIIRFDTGIEYEIQGIYQWNRYQWRWPS